ncbi:hypothetical protein SAPIO_CDS0012 [Scedosporium apiospermum]|uniref:Uncharacterized protein n=1 Tax=Pseudallescheria apiosperma TaxID=563466 RepID=A0A084GHC4_PSEDA|nr:uncharacterized protein SAPIO_CDS0012 [Scedosporium apiospermum]KEZ46736.1 hypothetical protein SAPIO_CDS0012 [Scedosporium apiospermum]
MSQQGYYPPPQGGYPPPQGGYPPQGYPPPQPMQYQQAPPPQEKSHGCLYTCPLHNLDPPPMTPTLFSTPPDPDTNPEGQVEEKGTT